MLRSYADSIKYRYGRRGNAMTIVPGIPERILVTHTVAAIVLAGVTGILLRAILPGEAEQRLICNLLDPVENLFISALMCITAPAVVYCSGLNVFLVAQAGVFESVGQLIFAILVGIVAMLVLYCLILVFAARLNPIPFIKKYAPTMKNTFLKGSGVAAIPMNMRISSRQLGVPQSVFEFSIPLGATVNSAGDVILVLFAARREGTLDLDTYGKN